MKKLTHLLALGILGLVLAAGPSAQDAPFAGSWGDDSAALLTENTDFLPVEKAYQLDPRIQNGRLMLHWTAAPGYYLYQHRFNTAQVTNGGELAPIEQTFEQGEVRFDDYYQRELMVYYDDTRVETALAPDGGQYRLRVESQGCADAGLCYPPRTQYLKVDFDSGQAAVVEDNPVPTPAPAPATGVDTGTALPSLAVILVFAIIGGVILNLMPCVFPVLSIKALGLAHAHTGTRGRHAHGLAYTAGLVSTFVVIALVLIALKAGGEALGWGFQLQSPLFVTALVYLFFLMGLSFSGYFQPGARLMGAGQRLTTGHGLHHSFFTGVLATVVASPCTAPFMGTALGFALTQSAPMAVLVFTFLGLGMALPFLLLAWWPGAARLLPRPGAWMETFKQFLAFPLYLTCVWLLWVLGRQAGPDALTAVIAGLVLLAFAIWLLQRRQLLRETVAAGVVVLALALPFLQQGESNREKIWEPYSPARLEQLLAQQRSVFINLTADWCITCLANERVALSSQRFRDILKEENIVYLKGDWTNYDADITELLQRNNRSSVPLYLFYRQGERTPVILPQILTGAMVADTLKGDK